MKVSAIQSAGFGVVLASMLAGTPAEALNKLSFVSASFGSDANPCTLASPCASFQAAHDATFDKGEINCIGVGDHSVGTLTITKSITIDCGGTLGTHYGVNVHIAGAGIIVKLRNITFQGGADVGSVGINFINGAAL